MSERITSKAANPTDVHVGQRVRMRRLMLHISQEKLGDAVGLTFQQIQKYEKGTNRIGASRLQQIADVLRVPVAFFFEGRHDPAFAEVGEVVEDHTAFLATREGLDLVSNFRAIDNPKLRRAIVNMIEAAAHPGRTVDRRAA